MTSQYPEHEKMAAVHEDSNTIGEFLEWMQAKSYIIAVWRPYRYISWATQEEVESENEQELTPARVRIEELLAQYFNIDLEKISAEKDAMLEQARMRQQERMPK